MKYLLLFVLITTTCIVKAQDFAALKAGQSKAEQIILNDEDGKVMMAFMIPAPTKLKINLLPLCRPTPINISLQYYLLWLWFYLGRKNIAMPVFGFM